MYTEFNRKKWILQKPRKWNVNIKQVPQYHPDYLPLTPFIQKLSFDVWSWAIPHHTATEEGCSSIHSSNDLLGFYAHSLAFDGEENLLVRTSVTAKEHFINPKFFFKEVVNLCTVIRRNSSIVKSFFIMWDDGWDFLWFEGSQHLPFSQYGNGQVRDLSHKNGVSLYLLYLQSGI